MRFSPIENGFPHSHDQHVLSTSARRAVLLQRCASLRRFNLLTSRNLYGGGEYYGGGHDSSIGGGHNSIDNGKHNALPAPPGYFVTTLPMVGLLSASKRM